MEEGQELVTPLIEVGTINPPDVAMESSIDVANEDLTDPETVLERLKEIDYKNYLAAAAVVGAGILVAYKIIGNRRARTREGTVLSFGIGDRHDGGLLATVVELAENFKTDAVETIAASFPTSEEAAQTLQADSNYKSLFAMSKQGIVYPLKGDPEHINEYVGKTKRVVGWVIQVLSSSEKKSEPGAGSEA